jgi:hypothetical protein
MEQRRCGAAAAVGREPRKDADNSDQSSPHFPTDTLLLPARFQPPSPFAADITAHGDDTYAPHAVVDDACSSAVDNKNESDLT